MAQDFQGVAESAAGGVSGKHLLKLIWLAFLTACSKSSSTTQNQPTCPSTTNAAPAAIQPDLLSGGRCSDLYEKIQCTGVTDSSGVSHRCLVGWTTAEFPYMYTQTSVGQSRGPSGEICVNSTVSFTFSANTISTGIDWQPAPGSVPTSCDSELVRFRTEIAQHEGVHVQQAQAIAAEATNRWSSKSFTGCGSTIEEAERTLRQVVDDAVRWERDSMKKKFLDCGQAFHRTDASKINEPDCAKCQYCQPP
jgi:hypothetical protein